VYEFGLKAFYDNVFVTMAVFNQQIKDFQTRGFDGVRFVSTNAGEVEVKGVEFDLNYHRQKAGCTDWQEPTWIRSMLTTGTHRQLSATLRRLTGLAPSPVVLLT
jgi:hypothetical protein